MFRRSYAISDSLQFVPAKVMKQQIFNLLHIFTHRISQTRQAINVLYSIWSHKHITKNRKLYIYQTIIQSILMYGAEVWQIPTRGIN
jgi:hypothetical protein